MADSPVDGVDQLGAVENELTTVDSLAPAEQVAAFARIHDVLTRVLANTAPDQSFPGPGRPQDR